MKNRTVALTLACATLLCASLLGAEHTFAITYGMTKYHYVNSGLSWCHTTTEMSACSPQQKCPLSLFMASLDQRGGMSTTGA